MPTDVPRNLLPLDSKTGGPTAARYCDCSAKTLRREIAARRLSAIRVGNRIKIRVSDLDAWLESRTIGKA